uniref:solute carrier family 35 member F5 isoform X2 n=1 Tax=Myxine glutinosa TaxID=7769 RepID=UPI00358F22CC
MTGIRGERMLGPKGKGFPARCVEDHVSSSSTCSTCHQRASQMPWWFCRTPRHRFLGRDRCFCLLAMQRPALSSAPAPTRRRVLLGIVILLFVDIIWVASSELSCYIFQGFQKPFFSTFARSSMFVVYLLGFLIWKPWRDKCLRCVGCLPPAKALETDGHYVLGKGGGDQRGSAELGAPLYAPVRFNDSASEKSSPCCSDVIRKPRVRFSRLAEVRQLPSRQVLDASQSRRQYGEPDCQEGGSRMGLPIPQVAKTSLLFCFVWFIANLSYQTALLKTHVTLASILISTSGVFTLILSGVFPSNSADRFTLSKLLAVCLSIGGEVLVRVSLENLMSEKHHLAGLLWSLAGAALYSIYIVALKRRVDREDHIDLPMFFGFIGLLCLVLLWPLFFLLHYTGLETFELPNRSVWLCLLVNGLLGTAITECLWLWGCFLTSSLVGTLALSLAVPLAVLADVWLNKLRCSWLFFLGLGPLLLAFGAAALLCQYSNWDPVNVGLRRSLSFLCRRSRLQRASEDAEQCESLISLDLVSSLDPPTEFPRSGP